VKGRRAADHVDVLAGGQLLLRQQRDVDASRRHDEDGQQRECQEGTGPER
jgi:hypothetical protein